MNKKIKKENVKTSNLTIIALGALLVSYLLSGCKPTPEQPFVVNKNDSDLNDVIANPQHATSESTVQPDTATNAAELTEEPIKTEHVTVKDSNIIDDKTINLYIDAKVELDYDKDYPIAAVEPLGFDINDANKIFPYFIEGDYYENRLKKDDYLWLITNFEKIIAESEIEEKHMDFIESELKHLWESYEDAPDDYIIGDIEFKNNNQGNHINLIGYNENGLLGEAFVANQGLQNTIAYYLRSDLSTKYTQSIEYSDVPARGMNMSYEDAKNQAQELVDYITKKEMGLEYSAYANEYNPYMVWVSESEFIASETANQCYVFYFTPQYNGINTLYATPAGVIDSDSTQQEEYREPWPSEYIEVMIDDNGVVEFWWVGKSDTLNVISENVDIIEYEQALSLFINNICYSSAWTSPVIQSVDINIDAIELRMVRIAVKDQIDSYIMVPAWVFIGNKTEVMMGGAYVRNDLVGRKCFMAINAYDGSIINLDLGY